MKKSYIYLVIILVLVSITVFVAININHQENIDTANNKYEKEYDNILINISDITFKLKGDNNYTINTNEEFIDPGFIASLKNARDLSDFVTITRDNIVENNQYNIIYRLEYENIRLTLKRHIFIKNAIDDDISKEELDKIKNQNNLNITLNGDSVLYILKNNFYKELGAFAFDNSKDISSKIKITGTVDTSKVGEYNIVYIIENDKEEKRVERKIIVYDYDLDISVSRVNDKINLIINNKNNLISYISINGEANEIYSGENIITILDNKEYKVRVFDKYGYVKEKVFNFIKPIISCSGSVKLNNTFVNVATNSDNISKYIYYFGSKKYESQKANYTISESYKSVTVEAIDTFGNTTKVSCNIQDEIPYFDSGLKEKKYNNWNYYLYVPNNVKQNEKKPLVIFLHGSEERGSKLSLLDSYGFAKYIKKGQTYDAFVLMPQLPSGKLWSQEVDTLMNLIRQVVNEYNIKENKISLSGFSLGAMGIPNIMEKNQNYFSCVVMIAVGGDNSSYAKYFQNIPVRFYTGSNDTRLGNSYYTKSFIEAVKKVNDNVDSVIYNGYPHNVVNKVLEDGNVINWMINQSR